MRVRARLIRADGPVNFHSGFERGKREQTVLHKMKRRLGRVGQATVLLRAAVHTRKNTAGVRVRTHLTRAERLVNVHSGLGRGARDQTPAAAASYTI